MVDVGLRTSGSFAYAQDDGENAPLCHSEGAKPPKNPDDETHVILRGNAPEESRWSMTDYVLRDPSRTLRMTEGWGGGAAVNEAGVSKSKKILPTLDKPVPPYYNIPRSNILWGGVKFSTGSIVC